MKTLTFFFSILVSLQFVNAGSFEDRHNHQLYYTAPATIWEETLPLGNGRLGMMPDGGVDRELIVLNEISLWSGMEADYGNPDASRSLPAIQQLLFEGKNKEAQELMYSSFVPKKPESGGTYGNYQMLADLNIDFSFRIEEKLLQKMMQLRLLITAVGSICVMQLLIPHLRKKVLTINVNISLHAIRTL